MVSIAVASVVLPFLPLTAGQILLNNLLSELPLLSIARDEMDDEMRARPHHWRLGALARFMAVFGLLSSVFGGLTFWLLLSVFSAGAETFRTAWFIESLLTDLAFTPVIRTARPAWRSRPAPLLLGLTILVACLPVILLMLPGAGYLRLALLPPGLLAAILGLTAAYALVTEAAKRLQADIR